MKRDIFLQLNYEHGPKARAAAFKKFREEMKAFPFIKIVKELEPKPEVIIEFPDDKYQEMYDGLRKLDIVELIDSVLPPSEA